MQDMGAANLGNAVKLRVGARAVRISPHARGRASARRPQSLLSAPCKAEK